MGGLSETIKNIKCPEFNDEMIEALWNAYDGSVGVYSRIQNQNALQDKSTIDRDEERDFRSKFPTRLDPGKDFQFIGERSDIEYCFGRLYINCSKQDIIKFSKVFVESCETKNLPFYFKYSYTDSKRADQIVC